ncbi:hypothetical protein C8R31_1108 [Nitrosospira sp. Nsp2]|uniref:hypothetical protein n=1 Tax=Nitrosospira sp. Nsp2 TaxID=136548 RepID=UPI000D43D058|nr:hypothetical protein [Nitrosospira sp. Nsp2]PTR13594.1 hypothetical protein C8R31_1108 [Nitrosospira sp. Nsp2]
MSNESVNYWKLVTIGILLVGASVGATLMITGKDSKTGQPESPAAQVELTPAPGVGEKGGQSTRTASAGVPPPPPQTAHPGRAAQPAHPSQSVMQACNQYANERVDSKTEEVLKNAALGAAIGAAVGAAGGAIAGGGSGAGKGAAIGGVTGAAGGSLYGLNETKSHDAQYREAYASCMRSKGY